MNLIISVPLNVAIAESLGKKGTEGNLTFYNRVIDNNAIVVLFPTNIKNNIINVAESMLLSDLILISTSIIDKTFGEVILAASLTKKHIIFTDDNDIKEYITSAKIKNFEIVSNDNILNTIINYSKLISTNSNNNLSRVDIDRAFTVKGIGNVALGFVTKGTIKVHDELYHNSGKKVIIKSIQSHDIDVDTAIPNMRVGLALKGIDSNEIEKGDILLSKPFNKTTKILTRVVINSLEENKRKLSKGENYMFVSNFQHTNIVVDNINEAENTVDLLLNTPLYLESNDSFFLLQNKAPRIFAYGEVI
ncbi:MAG: EF-Tu/IF-2/RF-3 family GTPase [Candidatus Micrarchaeia archaeon]